MENLQKLKEIANAIGANDLLNRLDRIEVITSQTDAELIFPLVGEFSSGKTTLINALTDSKKLETATKPTTATIFAIHFGCNSCSATITNENGETIEVEDISSLKNDELGESVMVNVFDTSTRIPSSTVLVDTPGLSSSDPKHRQALVNFLPQADGILLVTDINQQITRSLTDFIEMIKLSKRPIYLVITKCDTKSEKDKEASMKYISDNCKLPIEQMACVSAAKDDVSELNNIIADIQKNKSNIIKQVNEQRLKTIATELLNRIETLLKSSQSESEFDEEIRHQESELLKIRRNIESIISSSETGIEDTGRQICRQFEDTVSSRLETLVAGNSMNYDADAINMINGTASLMMETFKNDVTTLLRNKLNQSGDKDNAIGFCSLLQLDMSDIAISNLGYSMNLNNAGHEYDKSIATATKVAAVAAALVAIAPVATAGAAGATGSTAVAGSAGTAAATGAAGTATSVATAASVVDTATDVGSIIAISRMRKKLGKAIETGQRAAEQYKKVEQGNQAMGSQMGADKGLVESMVGLVTEKTMGKPQRRRAVHNYMDSTLVPQFKSEMGRIKQQLVNRISNILQQEAEATVRQMTVALQSLKAQRKEQKDGFEARISQLRDYKHELVTL